jgi:hypothetical protein
LLERQPLSSQPDPPGRSTSSRTSGTGRVWPESVAVGDVTGDGRGDVLLATEEDNDPENDFKLFFFRQLDTGWLD